MMDKEKLLSSGLLELYVLGIASPEEVEIVERVVAEHPELQTQIDEMCQSLEQYASLHAAPPPKGLKDKVFSGVDMAAKQQASATGATSNRVLRLYRTALGIAALLIVALGALYFSFQGQAKQIKQDYTNLAVSFDEYRENCETMQLANRELASQYDFLKDVNTMHVHLRGSGISPEALAVVFWNETEQGAYFSIVNLPEPPANKQYQLWADVEGEMISLGVFEMDSNLFAVPFIENAESLNVTLEPLGGSATPNVELLYMSGKV